MLAIATIARRVRLTPLDAEPVIANPSVTFRPSTAIRARVELRDDAMARV